MEEIYQNGTYLDSNPDWHQKDSQWKAMQIGKILERNAIEARKICEVGCGAGEILSQLSQSHEGKKFYGYEISPQAFELCQSKAKDNLVYKFSDLLNSNNSEYFDVIMAIDVLEHVEDYFGFLRKIKEKGEYKIFHIPLDLSVQSVLRVSPIVSCRSSAGHLHYFTKETALATLRDSGYRIVDAFYTAGATELPSKGWRTDFLKMPRKLAFMFSEDLAARVLGGYSLLVLAK